MYGHGVTTKSDGFTVQAWPLRATKKTTRGEPSKLDKTDPETYIDSVKPGRRASKKGRKRMPIERTRPPLSGETVSEEDLKNDDGEVIGSVEVHTYDPYPFEPSEALRAAVNAGNVKTSTKVVEANVKENGKVTKVYRQQYTRCHAQNEEGALAMADGDAKSVYEMFSERWNASDNQNIYVDLSNAAKGPQKALDRIEKILADLPESVRAEAREKLLGKLA